MALCATSSYYDITEVATRILPNVVVLTIDPNRTKAFQAIDQLLQIAKQHYEKTNATDTSCGVGSSFVPGNASLLG
ncbi:hypothetical protein JHK84_043641 [Glycine max]|nr:hypothetical protein JHK84_043641 [Glycine max]